VLNGDWLAPLGKIIGRVVGGHMISAHENHEKDPRKLIYILLWKYFTRQIYSCSFHISKLNNLKVIHDLYSQCLT
jgi:hypothetical protein